MPRNTPPQAEFELAYLRRQMEELRGRGLWPVSKVVAERDALREALDEVAAIVELAAGRTISPNTAQDLQNAMERPE